MSHTAGIAMSCADALHAMQVDWTLATDLLIDLFFMADIALNFNTGFISDQASASLAASSHCCQPPLKL